MTEINPILKNTSAYKIAENLDKQDGTADGKISGSVWNEFVKDKGGKEVREFISIEDAMKSITTYAIRGAKTAETSANDLGNKWFKSTTDASSAEDSAGADNAEKVQGKKNAPAHRSGNADNEKTAAAKQQGLRPTYNPQFYYNETEKEHYKWNPKTKKFTKYSNIAYFNKDQTYVRKYKNKDGSSKVINYSADGYATKMQARNWQNKNYLNKEFAAKRLGLQETYATKSKGVYYDKATKRHYQWNEKTHAFDAYGSEKVTFVDKNGNKYRGKIKAKITSLKNGARKEVITSGKGYVYENTYDTKGNLIKERNKDDSGKLFYTSDAQYLNNKQAKKMETYYDNGVKSSSENNKYDSKGKLIESTTTYFDNDGRTVTSSDIAEYDANGVLKKRTNRLASGEIENIEYWTKSADGNSIRKTTDASGKTTELSEFEYDAKGNATKQIIKTPDGKVTDVWEWKYNETGACTETIHKDGDGKVIKD